MAGGGTKGPEGVCGEGVGGLTIYFLGGGRPSKFRTLGKHSKNRWAALGLKMLLRLVPISPRHQPAFC